MLDIRAKCPLVVSAGFDQIDQIERQTDDTIVRIILEIFCIGRDDLWS